MRSFATLRRPSFVSAFACSSRTPPQQQLIRRSGKNSRQQKLQQPRRCFGLGDLSKLASAALNSNKGGGGNVQRFQQSREMDYSVEDLYRVVADIDSYHLFLPYCTHSKVVGPNPSSSSSSSSTSSGSDSGSSPSALLADLGIGFGTFQEKYRSRVLLTPLRSVQATALPDSSPIFDHLSTTWSFEPLSSESTGTSDGNANANRQGEGLAQGKGRSKIHFQLEYSFSNPVYAMLAGQVFEKTSDLVMGAFEKRAREICGR